LRQTLSGQPDRWPGLFERVLLAAPDVLVRDRAGMKASLGQLCKSGFKRMVHQHDPGLLFGKHLVDGDRLGLCQSRRAVDITEKMKSHGLFDKHTYIWRRRLGKSVLEESVVQELGAWLGKLVWGTATAVAIRRPVSSGEARESCHVSAAV
jgi:hypothetical protein